jgi:hypothetical protein
VIGTELYLSSRMSVPLKSPEGLKDHECEKGNLSHRPPIPYVPPTDLLPATSKIETIKIKVSDGSTVNMKIFSVGSPEEYLSHIVAVLHLIERKGLREQTKTFYGEMRNATAALQALQKRKALESKDGADDEQSEEELSEADKVELTQSQGIFKDSKSKYVKAIEATYEVMRTLLAGDPLTQWDRIVKEMHEGDSWAGPDGKEHKGSRLKCTKAFSDCLELHKLTVFSPDAAERQRYYIQQGIRKPQRASVRQFIQRMQQLSGYLEFLPTLKNSSRAVATTKKGNVPFEAADLASVILAALPLSWQNQYNLTHSTVPESPRVLTPELENIERVMKERDGEKHKSKDKAAVANPSKGKPNKGSPKGGSSKQAPTKKAKTEKFCQRCKTHGGSYNTHNTSECRRYDKDGKPTGQFGSKSSEKHKPFKKGGEKGLAYMTSMLEAIAKGQKKAAKGKKRKKRTYDSSSDSDSE